MFFLQHIDTVKWFDYKKFVPFEGYIHDELQSFFISKIKTLDVFGKYVIQADEKNPPLLSYNIYGDTQYWWILMNYNGFTLLDDLSSGVILLYPSLDDLSELYFSLQSEQELLNG